MTKTIYTIGHSNHEIERFLELLELHSISVIADVRSSPYSKYNPQFNREVLKQSLQSKDIDYVFLGHELGARRDEAECYVDNQAKYDLIAKTKAFTSGLDRISKGAQRHNIALMCSEKDPLTCHRAILVCKELKSLSYNILHILDNGSIETGLETELRLLALFGMVHTDLFRTKDEQLDDAYAKQADKIAYKQVEPTITEL